MRTITINGKSITLGPLTYGQVKVLSETLEKIAGSDVSPLERTDLSAQVLQQAHPQLTQEDLDATAPGVLLGASLEVYRITFARPEADAPAQ